MHGKLIRGLFCAILSMAVIGCGQTQEISSHSNQGRTNEELAEAYNATVIEMNDAEIFVDKNKARTDSKEAVYVANDIVFYLEGQDFTYGEGTKEDEHSQEEADKHTVIHITEPGNYVVSGKLTKGQIAVDLGDGAKKDEDAVVTLILNNVDITCEVAPAVIFYNVYECGSDDAEGAVKDVDTSLAGANVIIADGSNNAVNGSYVARIYESVELSEDGTEVVDSKKLHKYDGAFYSRRSMNISGEEQGSGILNIQAENEGLDSELHLTINGGNINITSGNDGINTNEDGVSVTTINGGVLTILVDGSTGEGDGIDSNGWLVINGGMVVSQANSDSMDAGLDSDMGIHINGGSVMATGNMLDIISESEQNYAVFTFGETQKAASYELRNKEGVSFRNVQTENSFTVLILSDENLAEGTYSLYKDGELVSVQETSGMMGGMRPQMPKGGERPNFAEGEEFPEMPEGGERPNFAEGEEFPEMPEGGERPSFSEGEEFPQMPENGEFPKGGKGGFGMNTENGEAVTEFKITNGGNMFYVPGK